MMEVAKGVGIGLLDKPFDAEEGNGEDKRTKDAPVYFDGEIVRSFLNTEIYVFGSVQIVCYRVPACEIANIQYRHTRRWPHCSTFTLPL